MFLEIGIHNKQINAFLYILGPQILFIIISHGNAGHLHQKKKDA